MPNLQHCAQAIFTAFEEYNAEFRRITQKARDHFESRAWSAAQQDAVRRIDLYDERVNQAVEHIAAMLGDDVHDRAAWAAIKKEYASLIASCPDSEFFKTFLSSITRRTFNTVGVAPDVEFVALDVIPTEHLQDAMPRRSYENRGSMKYLVDELLGDFAFATPYRQIDRTIRFVSAEIEAFCRIEGKEGAVRRIEMIEPVFYRGTRAFLVGRMIGRNWTSPLVLALKNTDEGLLVDSVILSEADVSILFSFTRSYFHVDLPTVGTTVSFLKSLLPRKPVDEIYTALGRAKQGKTERYRSFFHHLEHSSEKLVHARGEKGMVMLVFTLPSYDIVFKVIRDRFAYPKTASRQDVMERYQLVFKHDRAGRLVDAQEFRQLQFPKDRFDSQLLEDLLTDTAETCRIEGDDLLVDHCYIERRLTPLDIFIKEAPLPQARAAVIEYGQSIRDLARSNVFPGDLLLKNFGVTRRGRVIFYDYDELCFVTDCTYREMPSARYEEDETRAGAWFYVGPHDVFPEQFAQFLGFHGELLDAFMEHHADLLTAKYWRELKNQHTAGDLVEVLPYAPRRWTEHKGHGYYPATRDD